jgi:hypothetical protein
MKRMVGVGIVAGAVALLTHIIPAIGGTSVDVTQAEAQYLEASFGATGATVTGYMIHDYATLNHQFLSQSELAQVSSGIAKNLGLKGTKTEGRSVTEENAYQMTGIWGGNTAVSIFLSSFHMTDGMPNETDIVIRASSNQHSIRQLPAQMKEIANVLQNVHVAPQLDAYITGFTSKKLSEQETEDTVSRAFQSVHAVRIEGLNSALETSISGYSSEAPDYITSGGRKINLQVALHWDGYDKRTNVVVGTPIIVDPY